MPNLSESDEDIIYQIKNIDKRLVVVENTKHTCIHENEFGQIEKRLDNIFSLLSNTNTTVTDILTEQARSNERMKNKAEQNGKQDQAIAKLEEEDSTLKQDMVIVKTELGSLKDIMGQILALLKTIGASIILAAVLFVIKIAFGI